MFDSIYLLLITVDKTKDARHERNNVQFVTEYTNLRHGNQQHTLSPSVPIFQ
jgi:hypothetical protein